MIGRRTALSAILGLPVVAKGAMATVDSAVPNGTLDAVMPSEPDPLLEKARSFLDREEFIKNEMRLRNAEHLPPHLSERKSWSSAFKLHAHGQDLREEQPIQLWRLPKEELLERAIQAGLKL